MLSGNRCTPVVEVNRCCVHLQSHKNTQGSYCHTVLRRSCLTESPQITERGRTSQLKVLESGAPMWWLEAKRGETQMGNGIAVERNGSCKVGIDGVYGAGSGCRRVV